MINKIFNYPKKKKKQIRLNTMVTLYKKKVHYLFHIDDKTKKNGDLFNNREKEEK